MIFTTRPISDRAPFTGEHRPSNFGVNYSQMIQLLDRELWFLDGENVVIEIDVTESQIRNDGLPRADAKAASPACRLAFDSNQGPLIYATDAFVRRSYKRGVMEHDWQHNLYAIAKSLEALRLVDRYGVTGTGQQYTGFKALGAGIAMPASHMTSTDAVNVLTEQAGRRIDTDGIGPHELYKHARRAAHPDHNDGDHTLWSKVEEAGRVLGVTS